MFRLFKYIFSASVKICIRSWFAVIKLFTDIFFRAVSSKVNIYICVYFIYVSCNHNIECNISAKPRRPSLAHNAIKYLFLHQSSKNWSASSVFCKKQMFWKYFDLYCCHNLILCKAHVEIGTFRRLQGMR